MISLNNFFSPSSFSSSSETDDMNSWSFVMSRVSVHYISVYFLSYSDWVISIVLFSSSLILSFVFFFYFWAFPLSFSFWLLCHSVLNFPIWFFFISTIYLLRFSSFSDCSQCVCNYSLKYCFLMATWKSSRNNSNICAVSVLPSVDCLFSFKLKFYLS